MKSAEVETAKQVLDKLRNDKFDIIYDEDGKVSYHEKIINNDGVNNIIKVIIQMNDSVGNSFHFQSLLSLITYYPFR